MRTRNGVTDPVGVGAPLQLNEEHYMSEAQEQTQVSVRINEGNLLRNLRYAFSNRYTIVSELMQNARRAGASYVVVEYDAAAQTLMVRDDGCGIDDFQKLFTFGESGWDDATVANETAFGLGFTKSLYAAKTCTVLSKGRAISFDTAEALAQAPIDVKTVATSKETTVILGGVELPELELRIAHLVCGFPIRVIYNGVEQLRPHALDCLATIEAPIGRVFLRGHGDGKKASASSVIFLQGFIVAGGVRYIESENIVHLDSTQFFARLPDREVLIDASDQLKCIHEALHQLWRAHLLQEKAALQAATFVDRHFETARTWGLLDLFDDVPALPGSLFSAISDYPYREGYGDADYLTPLDHLVTREDIQDGKPGLVALYKPDEETVAHWMFARARGWVVFDDPGLSDRHWIKPFVSELEQAPCEVVIEGEGVRAELDGQWIWAKVVLCAAYGIRWNGKDVRITDAALYWHEQQLIIVPQGESSGRAARQVSDFIDGNNQWRESEQEHDQDALADLIRLLRATDPLGALQSLLADLPLERYPTLRGKTFRLKVGQAADERELALVDG
jgi:hypothetical protein